MNIFIPGFLNEIQNVPFMKNAASDSSEYQKDVGECFYHSSSHSSSSFSNSEYYDASNNSLSTTLFTLFLVVLSMEAIVLALCTIYSWCQLPTASQHGQTPEFWWIRDHVDDDDDEDNNLVSSALLSNNDDDYDEYNFEDENDETDWLMSSIGSIGGSSRSRHRCNSPDRIEAMIEERSWELICVERQRHWTAMRGSGSSSGSVAIDNDQDECCAICLNPYDDTDTVAGSKGQHCRHLFHKHCLVRWLQRQTTCPCCRQEWLHHATRRSNYNSFASFSVSSTRQLIQEQFSRRRSSGSFQSLNSGMNNLFSTLTTATMSSSASTAVLPAEDAISSSWRSEDTETTSTSSSGSTRMAATVPPAIVLTTSAASSNNATNDSNTEYQTASPIASASWGGSGFCFFLS